MRRIDHVGIVVEDLEAATRLLSDGLGMQPDGVLDRPDLEARFLGFGEGRIELIGVRDAAARTARLGGADVPARIEHIAIEVDDLEATLAILDGLGIETTGPPRESAGALTVWTRAATSGGIGFQFLQRPAAAPDS